MKYIPFLTLIIFSHTEIYSLLTLIFFSRKERKERRDLLPFVFHAGAGVVANFVTTRVRREFYPPPPPCGGCPHVAMGIATLIGHRMTSSHSSKDPLRPPVSGGESVTTGTGTRQKTVSGFGSVHRLMFVLVVFRLPAEQDDVQCDGENSENLFHFG